MSGVLTSFKDGIIRVDSVADADVADTLSLSSSLVNGFLAS